MIKQIRKLSLPFSTIPSNKKPFGTAKSGRTRWHWTPIVGRSCHSLNPGISPHHQSTNPQVFFAGVVTVPNESSWHLPDMSHMRSRYVWSQKYADAPSLQFVFHAVTSSLVLLSLQSLCSKKMGRKGCARYAPLYTSIKHVKTWHLKMGNLNMNSIYFWENTRISTIFQSWVAATHCTSRPKAVIRAPYLGESIHEWLIFMGSMQVYNRPIWAMNL